ncbi:MAG: recombinase family protein [Oscillospiraceae bacterium]|nr:recombinase family protein [Oscillospiraceae bacterium]
MTDKRIHGYARVSTDWQITDRQVNALLEYGINKRDIYEDRISGNRKDRPQLDKLLNNIRKGDLVVITSIDRLGRNYTIVQDIWKQITIELEADIKVLDMQLLDTTQSTQTLDSRFIADLTLQILSYVAEKERDSIKARQAQGIETAKKRGQVLGRPKATYPINWHEIHKKWKEGKITATAAMQELGLKRNTFYKLDKKYVDNYEKV